MNEQVIFLLGVLTLIVLFAIGLRWANRSRYKAPKAKQRPTDVWVGNPLVNMWKVSGDDES